MICASGVETSRRGAPTRAAPIGFWLRQREAATWLPTGPADGESGLGENTHPTPRARRRRRALQGASAPCASTARTPNTHPGAIAQSASGSPHEVAQWRARRGVRVDGAVRLGSRVDADAEELSPFCANAPCTLRSFPCPARTSCADLRALAALPRGRPPALFTPLRSGCGAWGSGSAGIGRTDIWRAPPRGGLRPGGTDIGRSH